MGSTSNSITGTSRSSSMPIKTPPFSSSASSTSHNVTSDGSSGSGKGHSSPSATISTTSMIPKDIDRIVKKENITTTTTSRSVTPHQTPSRPKAQTRSNNSSADLRVSRNPFHKLIHHNEKDSDSRNKHGVRSRAKSLLHISNAGTNTLQSQQQQHSTKPLQRASTSASYAVIRETVTVTLGNPKPPKKQHDKIVFNPYGLNNAAPKDKSFYLEDSDVKNLLPMPIENPNDHLPIDMREDLVDLTDFYEIPEKSKSKVIGDGASSDVRIVNEIGNKKKRYALKKLLLFKGEAPDHFYKRVASEFVIAKNVSNGFHIVTTLELLRVATTGGIHRGWGITMELCEGGDLFSLANSPGWRNVAKEEKLCIFKQVAFGIKYLHEKDIAHIDLKPENVLLTNDGVVKLTDFGISRFAHKTVGDFNSEINYITKRVGSAPYSPPEMMELDKDKTILVEPFKVDMWALGVMLSVLFYSRLPFNEASNKDEAYRKYLLSLTSFQNKYNPDMKIVGLGPGSDYQLAEKFSSKEASYMCWRLMNPSDKKRYTLEELFSDPFFEKIKTCTDELNHLTDLDDELCNHDHVFDLREKGYYSNSNSSAESLHRPIRSMLDMALINPVLHGGVNSSLSHAALSRSSSASSTSTTGSPTFLTRLGPISTSPVKPPTLDPSSQPQLHGIRASSASLERRKSYDKNGKFMLYRTTSNSSLKSINDGSDSPPRFNNSQFPQQQVLEPSSTDLPPLEEDEAEKDVSTIENHITKKDDDGTMAATATTTKDDQESMNANEGGKSSTEQDDNDDDDDDDKSDVVANNESTISLPRQTKAIRQTLLGETDMTLLNLEHGLVLKHCLIGDDVLKKCCCFDAKTKHRHIRT